MSIDYSDRVKDEIRITDFMRAALKQKVSLRSTRLIIFLSEGGGGSDYIRIVGPALLNTKLKNAVTLCLTTLEFDASNSCSNISHHILKRIPITIIVAREKISDQAYAALCRLRAAYDIKLIVDLDDDLFSITELHPEYESYVQTLEKLKELLVSCDVVTTSTRLVMEGIRAKNITADGYIIPNYLDDRVWALDSPAGIDCGAPEPHRDEEPVKILYFGTETHDDDLRILETVLPNVKKRVLRDVGRNVELNVVGGTCLQFDSMTMINVPSGKRSYVEFVHWLQSLGRFDLAVAPLTIENSLNHAKSSLKFIEYAALGLPAVYTKIEAYEDIVEDGKTGILVKDNDLSAWEDALVKLCTDSDLRNLMGASAREELVNKYLLRDHFGLWASVFVND